jgi:hypothetical protein
MITARISRALADAFFNNGLSHLQLLAHVAVCLSEPLVSVFVIA